MATRGNIVFGSKYYIEEKELTETDFKKVRPKSWFVKKSHNIYIHSDMYPRGALSDLFEFLRMDGAKHRAHDTSYLSAYFTGFKVIDMLKWTRSMSDRDFNPEKCTNPGLEDMKASRDFFGIGLLNELSDWASYSYLIVPKLSSDKYYTKSEENSFDIYIYEGNFDKFVLKVNTEEDDVEELEETHGKEDWWY